MSHKMGGATTPGEWPLEPRPPESSARLRDDYPQSSLLLILGLVRPVPDSADILVPPRVQKNLRVTLLPLLPHWGLYPV